MNKVKIVGSLIMLTSIFFSGCNHDSEEKSQCLSNMAMVQMAVEQWLDKNGSNGKMPSMKQLVGDGFLEKSLSCPTDGASYTYGWSDGEGSYIKVSCPNIAKGHKYN